MEKEKGKRKGARVVIKRGKEKVKKREPKGRGESGKERESAFKKRKIPHFLINTCPVRKTRLEICEKFHMMCNCGTGKKKKNQ